MKTQLSLVLLAVAMLLPAGCSTGSRDTAADPEKLRTKWEAEVRSVIKDPQRAERIVALGYEVEAKNRLLQEEIAQLNEAMKVINGNYDSTRQDYEGLLARFTEDKNVALRQLMDCLFAMRQETTPAEWKALVQ